MHIVGVIILKESKSEINRIPFGNYNLFCIEGTLISRFSETGARTFMNGWWNNRPCSV